MMAFRLGPVAMVSVLILCAGSCANPTVGSADVCEDFLAKWGRKPKEVNFSNCKKVERSQVDRLVAFYWLKGTDAAIVEGVLQEKFKMASLKVVCCGWTPTVVRAEGNLPGHGTYMDQDRYQYEIAMTSEETVLNRVIADDLHQNDERLYDQSERNRFGLSGNIQAVDLRQSLYL